MNYDRLIIWQLERSLNSKSVFLVHIFLIHHPANFVAQKEFAYWARHILLFYPLWIFASLGQMLLSSSDRKGQNVNTGSIQSEVERKESFENWQHIWGVIPVVNWYTFSSAVFDLHFKGREEENIIGKRKTSKQLLILLKKMYLFTFRDIGLFLRRHDMSRGNGNNFATCV